MTVSVTNLKARLSEILRAVKAGEEVVVTERGRPVALLSPLAASTEQDVRLQKLVGAGVVRPGKGRLPHHFADAALPRDDQARARHALLEERRTGR